MVDYHIHTTFSPDSLIKMDEYIEKAIHYGLEEICFTDHKEFYEYDKAFHFDYENYIKYFENLQRNSKIKILAGIEIGYRDSEKENIKKYLRNKKFDYILLAIHTLENITHPLHKNRYLEVSSSSSLEFYKNDYVDIDNVYREYYDLLYKATQFEEYDAIAHFDIPKRYTHQFKEYNIKNYESIISEILKYLIENDKVIEINMSGYKKGIIYPSYDILDIYKDSGGRYLTAGSDSHNLDNFGITLEAKEIIKRYNFKIVKFRNRVIME